MRHTLVVLMAVLLSSAPFALERKDVTFEIFQFPASQIPRVDGKVDDWAIVPDNYAVGMDQLMDTEQGHGMNHDTKNLDVKVKVGWVKGLNRDGDLSGGPLIDIYHRDVWTPEAVGPRAELDPRVTRPDAHFAFHGVHAQNYHIFTPPGEKDWAMAWGCAQYTKELPYANAAYEYSFKPGESGKLVLEFWITPFDYASCDGPQHAVESQLKENALVGLS
jgi:hypothetical protein